MSYVSDKRMPIRGVGFVTAKITDAKRGNCWRIHLVHARKLPKCLAIFDDPGYYPITFDEWFGQAQNSEKELLRRCSKVIRVVIDPNTFPAWCAANGFDAVDAKARNHFVHLKAAESAGLKPNEVHF